MKKFIDKSMIQDLKMYTSRVLPFFSQDDVTDNAISLLDPSLKYHGLFKQTKWPAIPLGTRVRRGPTWTTENQDLNMAGTVIGEDTTGRIVLFFVCI